MRRNRAGGTVRCATLALGVAIGFASVAHADEPAPIDVTVEGDKASPGAVSLGRKDIREMPGVLGDPYRAIETQPGVTPAVSGLPYYFIRGAPPGNVGYFFDGIQVPLLFHVGAGPSVIPPSIVDRVELHLGSFPARYGRLAGAVVEADSTPPRDTWHGEAAFRTVDIGGTIEGPIAKDQTLMVGGHYSIGTSLVSALVKSIGLNYADYQGRYVYKISPRSRFTITTFGSYDFLKTVEKGATVITGGRPQTEDVDDVLINSDFHRLDFRYDRELESGGSAQIATTFGLDRSRGIGLEHANDWRMQSRASIQKPMGGVLLRAGADAQLDGYDVAVSGDPCPGGFCPQGILGSSTRVELEQAFKVLFKSRLDLALGAWADTVVALGHSATITPGVRVDYYNSLSHAALAVDPRLVGKFAIGEHLTLVPAVGVASQLPSFAPVPAMQIGGIPGGLQRSLQSSFGAEVRVFPFDFRATGFRQTTFNLTDSIGTDRGGGFGVERFLNRTIGDGYGLELAAKGPLTRNIAFMAAYTLSRSTRERLGRTVPSAYDRTHVAQLGLLYDLGRNWRAGVRMVFYTGFPADEAGADRIPSTHPKRTQPFFRIDARLAKRWVFKHGAFVGLVFDMQNATLSREVFDVTCNAKTCSPRVIGPITIPTLAFESGF